MKVKSGQAVIDAIRLAYAAGKPVMLEGRHGVGKSQLIEAAAASLGIEFIVRDLSLMEPPDLIGLPFHQENGKTRYAPPSFLPESGKGLLVFEELNRSEKYMMAPCLQLLTARTLNDYRLPDGWLCVAAINPASEGYDTQELDPALLSRFIRITLDSDPGEWLQWADLNGVHPAICRFIRNTPDIFIASESNPRAWTWSSDIMHAYEQAGGGNDGLLTVAISGLVGDALGTAVVQSYLNGEEPISGDEIIGTYDRHRRSFQSWVKAKKIDLVNATAHNVMCRLQNSDVCTVVANSKANQQNLEEFISDLPADIGKRLKQAAKKAGVL